MKTKLVLALLVCLVTGAAGQQPPAQPPAAQPNNPAMAELNRLTPALKACRALESRLRQMRDIPIEELENMWSRVVLCPRSDPTNRESYRRLSFVILVEAHARMARFLQDSGDWPVFLRWDSDPNHR